MLCKHQLLNDVTSRQSTGGVAVRTKLVGSQRATAWLIFRMVEDTPYPKVAVSMLRDDHNHDEEMQMLSFLPHQPIHYL